MRAVDWLCNPRTYYRSYRDIPRLLLAAIFLVSAFLKHLDPDFFYDVLRQYKHLPPTPNWALGGAVIGVFVAEYLVGLGAFLRLFPRLTVLAALALNGVFVTVLAMHWGETLPLGCGCFGFPKETVVNIRAFWLNLVLLLLTLAAGYVAFTERPEPPRDRSPHRPEPGNAPAA
jgi:hypothetical protein